MGPEQREDLDEIVVKMRAGRMTRRTFLQRAAAIGLSSAAAVSLLEACGGGGGGGPATISWESEHDSANVYGPMVDEFNKSNKDNITVNFVNGPNDTGQLRTKFTTMLRGRSGDIDIMSMDIIWPAEFAANGWTVPLDKYWPASERANYLAGPVKGCTFNGQVWAAPLRTDTGLIYYRSDIIPTAPNTWDDLTSMANDAQTGGKTKYGYVWQGAQYEGLVCDFVEVVYGYGGNVLDPNDPTKVTINSPEAVQALTKMVDWVGKISPSAVTNYKEEDARSTWQNGDSAFMRNWPYAIALGNDPSTSRVAAKFHFHPMLYGGSNTIGHSNVGGWQLGINAFSKNPDAAWKFISYMLQPAQQKRLAIVASLNATLKSIYDDPDVLAKQPDFAMFKSIFDTALPRPVSPKYPDITLAIQQRVHDALLGKTTPAAALSALASDLQGLVSK